MYIVEIKIHKKKVYMSLNKVILKSFQTGPLVLRRQDIRNHLVDPRI